MSYRDKQEELQRRAKIATSRANPETRQKARQSMGDFFSKLLKPRQTRNNRAFGSSPLQQALAQQQAGNMTPQAEALLAQSNPNEIARQQGLMASGRHGSYKTGAPMPYIKPNIEGARAYDPAARPTLIPEAQELQRPVEPQQTTTATDGIPTKVDLTKPRTDEWTAPTDMTAGDLSKTASDMYDNAGKNTPSSPEKIDTSNVSQAVSDGNIPVVNHQIMMQKFMRDPSKMTANNIKQMQQTLNNLGVRDKDGNELSVDGRMGPLTASAMERWKADTPTLSQQWDHLNVNPYAPTLESPEVSQYAVDRPDRKLNWRGDPVYQDIQQTIGNPFNDPVMFGMQDLQGATNPLQYDVESGEVFDPYR